MPEGLPSSSIPPSCFPPVPVPITHHHSLPAARALRNVWLWLANMSRVCNRELGTPYNRCLRLFDDAKDNCERTIPLLFFLCYIIVTFRTLCSLATCEWVPTLLQQGKGVRGSTRAHCEDPTLTETPPLCSCPHLLCHPGVHPDLPPEANRRP